MLNIDGMWDILEFRWKNKENEKNNMVHLIENNNFI